MIGHWHKTRISCGSAWRSGSSLARHPPVRAVAKQNHIHRLPARLLHGRAGSLIVFVVLIFWFARKQNQIDEEFGVHEDE
jgi:hypothetical protein